MSELATIPNDVAVNYRKSSDVAGVCKEIVLMTAVNIQGKKYVKAEGWLSIATAHGCIASARDVEKIDGGIRAIGEIRRMSDGAVLATAEGFVGDDENTWSGRAEYARRAMAQTRAISRACRTAFAHVVVLMDANLETTPAEEVPNEGFENAKPVAAAKVEVEEKKGDSVTYTLAEDSQKKITGLLTGVNEASGETATGKAWKRWQLEVDTGEHWPFKVSTFDAKLGEAATKLEGKEVELTVVPSKKNPKYSELLGIAEVFDPPVIVKEFVG